MARIIYTGVGSRNTPTEVLNFIRTLAGYLQQQGWVLRSGAARGADEYFEKGVKDQTAHRNNDLEVYLPWDGFRGIAADHAPYYHLPSTYPNWAGAGDIAAGIHPAWQRLTRAARILHTRNVYQVLGKDLARPSDYILYFAPPLGSGLVEGGTNTAVQLARQHGVPELNLWYPEVRSLLGLAMRRGEANPVTATLDAMRQRKKNTAK